jgi:hypothetical protein
VKVREGGRRHKGVEKDILGAFIREGKRRILEGELCSWTRERFVFGIDTVTGVARGFGLGGPGYP